MNRDTSARSEPESFDVAPDRIGEPLAGERLKSAQRSTSKDQGLTILSYLLAGIGLYGGLGWLADRAFHTSFLIAVGLILGAVISMYIIIKRYGSVA
ncbi:hypothetical protein [Propionimicrobium sp. PCR01-08-3]|uniref:AtpZ/AtpI family protein n=1 Tax=Propionimicrobium sp. PCR01-08-3 TaxID=3052086 RepID=UPI00255CD97C|nr:hypothetical protein [Propionimicrobium sp. PCR01-08-3]WIY83815.1 hypothetical protein QQ658_05575 [Propionimicrobium sp. PCR01-08-3]